MFREVVLFATQLMVREFQNYNWCKYITKFKDLFQFWNTNTLNSLILIPSYISSILKYISNMYFKLHIQNLYFEYMSKIYVELSRDNLRD